MTAKIAIVWDLYNQSLLTDIHADTLKEGF